jgi:glycosyltransferase involved in cell wall biosynthesis
MNQIIDFSIITPSYNMLDHLKHCCASVADQDGVSFEHIIIDGGSSDGTVEWLQQNQNVVFICEKDEGMYDAINKGLGIAKGKYFAYLNCDEQYLPDTLSAVKDKFCKINDAEILYGDTLILNPHGKLIAYRKSHKPRWFYIYSSYLYILSCSMFFRRKIIDDGFLFNKELKSVADADLVIRLLQEDYKFAHIKQYLSTFTITGQNKSKEQYSIFEKKEFEASAPQWVKLLKIPLNAIRLSERMVNGIYHQSFPLSFAIFINNEKDRRTYSIERASAKLKW